MTRQRWVAALAASCALAICGMLAGCSSPEERLQGHIDDGNAYLEALEVREAVLEFRNALKLRPDDPALYEQLGKALYRAQHMFEALPYFEQAHAMDPSRTEATLYLARLVASSELERARDLLNPILESNPDDALTQQTLAHVLLHEEKPNNALKAAERAVELDPENIDGWIQLGNVLKARIRSAQTRRKRPSSETFKAAIAAFDRVDALRGGSSRAQIEKARIYAIWPKHEKQAQKTYDHALQMARAGDSPLEISLAAWAMDEYGLVRRNPKVRRKALRAILEVDDDNYEAWGNLGRLVDGQPGHSGEELYAELLERRPDDARSYVAYAGFLVRKGRQDDGEATIRRALDDGVDGAGLYEWLIRARILDGQLGDAMAVYDEMAEAHPQARETRIAEARLSIARGKPDQAATQLTALLTAETTPELLRLLALAEYRQGRLAEAHRAIERSYAMAARSVLFPTIRLRARIAHDIGKFSKTIEMTRILVGRGQTLDDGERTRLATALHRVGRREDSLPIFEKNLSKDPPPRETVLAFAQLEGKNDPERTYELLQKALQAVPNDFEIVEAITMIDLQAGRRQVAMQRLNQLVAARLADPSLILLRAKVLAALGAWDAAERDALRAFEADPKLPGAVDLLFAIYGRHDQLDQVRASFEQAEKSGVLHPGARILLARLYLADGKLERARDMLEIVVQEMPDYWVAQNDLAFILAALGEDLDRALELAREAHPRSGGTAATADTVGWVLLKSGRADSAVAHFTRAIKLANHEGGEVDPAFQYHHGLALLAMGRTTQAIAAFESALERGEFFGSEDARRELEAARHQQSEAETSS